MADDAAREAVERAFLEIMAARHPGIVWRIVRPEGEPPSRVRPVCRQLHSTSEQTPPAPQGRERPSGG